MSSEDGELLVCSSDIVEQKSEIFDQVDFDAGSLQLSIRTEGSSEQVETVEDRKI